MLVSGQSLFGSWHSENVFVIFHCDFDPWATFRSLVRFSFLDKIIKDPFLVVDFYYVGRYSVVKNYGN